METLKAQIPWEEMTATVTTLTFKRIKEYVLEMKEQTERNNVLVHPDELRAQLEATDADWQFTDAEMMTAVGHLANHGYVTVLRGSKGEAVHFAGARRAGQPGFIYRSWKHAAIRAAWACWRKVVCWQVIIPSLNYMIWRKMSVKSCWMLPQYFSWSTTCASARPSTNKPSWSFPR